ncbi:hypothetical protein Glove_301g27 [Diversispora epigaea]|uniref:G-protein alpha subunit n=1 Tax=Diversispora epigaea TaxID=1348612 RepID=A0A397I3J0_9GLOM|nr:hypothetical protein Glove_301g27 [Diversispora epigaea]
MGLCLSAEEKESKLRSYQIDKQIEEDSKRFNKKIKVLLPGNESGKSTIFKQIKIHQNGNTKDGLVQYRIAVYNTLVDSAQTIVYAMRKLRMEPQRLENKDFAEKILDYYVESDPSFQLSSEIVEAIDSLWHDPIISEVMEKQNHFYLIDSVPYFLAAVKRIGVPGYIPNELDSLLARTETTGPSETRFDMGQLSIHIFDVDNRSVLKRRIRYHYEDVTSIIFCVALSEYDQNGLAESLLFFEHKQSC